MKNHETRKVDIRQMIADLRGVLVEKDKEFIHLKNDINRLEGQQMELERELLTIAKEEAENTLCNCGHKHISHGIIHSVNYTAGRCLMKDCYCNNFIQK